MSEIALRTLTSDAVSGFVRFYNALAGIVSLKNQGETQDLGNNLGREIAEKISRSGRLGGVPVSETIMYLHRGLNQALESKIIEQYLNEDVIANLIFEIVIDPDIQEFSHYKAQLPNCNGKYFLRFPLFERAANNHTKGFTIHSEDATIARSSKIDTERSKDLFKLIQTRISSLGFIE